MQGFLRRAHTVPVGTNTAHLCQRAQRVQMYGASRGECFVDSLFYIVKYKKCILTYLFFY
jgi:hypothetical protein